MGGGGEVDGAMMGGELGGVSSTTCSVDGSSGYFSSKWTGL